MSCIFINKIVFCYNLHKTKTRPYATAVLYNAKTSSAPAALISVNVIILPVFTVNLTNSTQWPVPRRRKL